MRAGNLNEHCNLIRITVSQSASGAQVRHRDLVLENAHCQRLSKVERAMMAAGLEEYSKSTVILRLRHTPQLTESTHYLYEGALYRIDSRVRSQADKTVDVTGVKVNE